MHFLAQHRTNIKGDAITNLMLFRNLVITPQVLTENIIVIDKLIKYFIVFNWVIVLITRSKAFAKYTTLDNKATLGRTYLIYFVYLF